MSQLDHPCIVRLLGVCLGPPMILVGKNKLSGLSESISISLLWYLNFIMLLNFATVPTTALVKKLQLCYFCLWRKQKKIKNVLLENGDIFPSKVSKNRRQVMRNIELLSVIEFFLAYLKVQTDTASEIRNESQNN